MLPFSAAGPATDPSTLAPLPSTSREHSTWKLPSPKSKNQIRYFKRRAENQTPSSLVDGRLTGPKPGSAHGAKLVNLYSPYQQACGQIADEIPLASCDTLFTPPTNRPDHVQQTGHSSFYQHSLLISYY